MSQHRETILVVDDDKNDLEMTVTALKGCGPGIDVVTARDGAEALDYLYTCGDFRESSSGRPAFLLLDLNMPCVDGWEVLHRIKADAGLQTVPVIVFTSSVRERDVERSYRLGANAYVVKPFAFDDLSGTVKDIQAFWTRHNRPPPAAQPASGTDFATGD